MPQATLAERVSRLEDRVETLATREDVNALSGQIAQLRAETLAAISAQGQELREVRAEIPALDDKLERRTAELRDEIRAGDEQTRAEISALDEKLERRTAELRDEIRDGDEQTRGLIERRTAEILQVVATSASETQAQNRMLCEDLVDRLGKLKG